jgi:hypothetical protein
MSQQAHEFKQSKSSKPAPTTRVANSLITNTSVQLSKSTFQILTLATLWKDVSDQSSGLCLFSGKQQSNAPSPIIIERERQVVGFPIRVHAEHDAADVFQVLVCDEIARCELGVDFLFGSSVGRCGRVAVVHGIDDENVGLPVVTETCDLHFLHFGVELPTDEERVFGWQGLTGCVCCVFAVRRWTSDQLNTVDDGVACVVVVDVAKLSTVQRGQRSGSLMLFDCTTTRTYNLVAKLLRNTKQSRLAPPKSVGAFLRSHRTFDSVQGANYETLERGVTESSSRSIHFSHSCGDDDVVRAIKCLVCQRGTPV